MMKEASPFPLSEATQRLFPEPWARLVALKGSEAKGFEAIERPDPPILVLRMRETLANPWIQPELRRSGLQAEEAMTLVDVILNGLRADGRAGRLAADGIFVGTGQRQIIPAELWSDARFEFGANTFMSGDFVYHHVRLSLASAPSDDEKRVAEVVEWLKQRRTERGDEPKKLLLGQAQKMFGEFLLTREFNTAYAQCYDRSRGRPRKRK